MVPPASIFDAQLASSFTKDKREQDEWNKGNSQTQSAENSKPVA